MSSIGGPGGIGGPKGPAGPTGPGDVDGAGDVDDVSDVTADAGLEAARAARALGGLEAMAADIASGKLTAREAVDRMVDDIATTDHLGATEQAELRELLTDLVENDPYLGSLVGRA
jgi:hypothetical protein